MKKQKSKVKLTRFEMPSSTEPSAEEKFKREQEAEKRFSDEDKERRRAAIGPRSESTTERRDDEETEISLDNL